MLINSTYQINYSIEVLLLDKNHYHLVAKKTLMIIDTS